VGKGAYGMTISGRMLWVANREDDTLTRVDTRSRTTRLYGGFASPLTLLPDGSRVWVGSDSSNRVVAIDGLTGVVVEQLRLPARPASYLALGAGSLWASHDGLHGFFRNDASRMTRVDLTTHEATGLVLGVGAWATSVTFAGHAAWVALSGKGDLVRIDARDGARVRVSAGRVPIGAAVGFGSVWVTSFEDDVVRRLNPVTGEVEAVVRVGRGPFAVATGAGSVWVANHAACTVSRVDPEHGKVIATIPTRFFPAAVHVGAGAVWVTVLSSRFAGATSNSATCAGTPQRS
jgi:serine/threonine-protein kinase